MNTKKSILYAMVSMGILTGSAFAAKAQNLVPNPSFENANCPTGYNGLPSQVALYMQDWYSANCASPDVMTNCSVNTGQAVNTNVPRVWFGFQYARTGNNYMGFGFYQGWYEYLGARLTEPLVAGVTYDVSFFVSCANDPRLATDALGMYFSTTEIRCTSGFSGPVLNYTPQVIQTPGVFLTDTLGWEEVSGSFTAQGGEEYIVIGYFRPWNICDFLPLYGSTSSRCYYYLDDVSVTRALPAPAQPGSISGLQTVCEGSTQTYSVPPVPGASSYTWTLPPGWTGTSVTNSITATVGTGPGNVTVTANNSSGTSVPQTVAVAVNHFPAQPGTISGPAALCPGATAVYSLSPVADAAAYFWTLPAGWSGSSNTTSVTVTAGTAGGMLTGSAQNGCGTSGTQIPVSVVTPDVSVTQSNGQLFAAAGADAYQWVDCGAGYAELPAQNQQGFVPSASGSYAVAVTLNGCKDTSACLSVQVIPSGVSENASAAGISLYPNPVKQSVLATFRDIENGKLRFSVSDLGGKQVWQGQADIQQHTALLRLPDGIANGIYMLETRAGERVSYHKIVVEQ